MAAPMLGQRMIPGMAAYGRSRARCVLASLRPLTARRYFSDDAAPLAAGAFAVPGGPTYPEPRAGVDWKNMGFALSFSRETMMVMSKCKLGGQWRAPKVEPYGPLNLEPAATILNYGQGIFEGIKAYRTSKGRIVLFRPQKNGERLSNGARRFLMPAVPTQLFLEACCMAVKANAEFVPPAGVGALYLRPILFGSGADLGVKPSSEYTLCVYVAPVGSYFGPGTAGARMKLCMDHHRAAPYGVGNVKAAGNYAQCFAAQRDAKADGFSDVIYLDVDGEHIEEAAASNFFCVDNNKTIHTPQLGTILPGVTRDTIIQLARRLKSKDIRLNVGKVDVRTVLSATEAFVTGTGAGITPIEHVATDDESVDFNVPGPVTTMLKQALLDIQLERVEDTAKWLHDPFKMPLDGHSSYMEPVF